MHVIVHVTWFTNLDCLVTALTLRVNWDGYILCIRTNLYFVYMSLYICRTVGLLPSQSLALPLQICTYYSISLYLYLTDINECSSNNGGCSQFCTNTDGSFRCSCRSGFRLGSNQRSCSGMSYLFQSLVVPLHWMR